MSLKTLEDVLSEICKETSERGVPLCSKQFKLYVWTNTIDCKPTVGIIDVNFNLSMITTDILNIFKKINSITPISMILIDKTKYHVTKTEAFMKKPCRCS